MTLRPDHAEKLARFRISPEDLERVYSASDFEVRELLGVNGFYPGENLGGIVFEYRDPVTEERVSDRIRRDQPSPDGAKYIGQKGNRRLFFTRGVSDYLRNSAVDAVIVEAEKSALAIASLCGRAGRRMLPIAIGGCWGFLRKRGKRPLPNGGSEDYTGPSPDFDLVEWTNRVTIIALDSNAASNPSVRAARRALTKMLAERGADLRIAELPEGVNGPDDLIADRGDEPLLTVLDAAAPVGRPLRTDGGNADRFARENSDWVKYCTEQGAWYAWSGRQWERNGIGEVHRRARLTASRMWDEVKIEVDEKKKKELTNWALHADSRAGLEAMVSIARFNEAVEVPKFDEAFDRDPLLLNCQNGILNLRTGEFIKPRRELMLTRIAGVDWDQKADCPEFKEFIRSALPDDAVREYFQRVGGYFLTGLTSEQAIFVWHGETGTSKSTNARILRLVMGSYADSLPSGALLVKKNEDEHAFADLPGVRLATCVETAQGRTLDEAKIKSFTGQDPQRTRHLYENSFEFVPQAKLLMVTNHLPVVRDTDDAIWRRIKPIEFTVKPDKEIKDFAEKLVSREGSGILAWFVEGCKKYLSEGDDGGLKEPDAVTQAAKKYRREQDEVADFLADTIQISAAGSISKAALYAEYCRQARMSHRPMSKKRFSQEMKRLFYGEGKGRRENMWECIEFKPEIQRAMAERAEAAKGK